MAEKTCNPVPYVGVQDDVKNNATSIDALQGTLDTLFLFPLQQRKTKRQARHNQTIEDNAEK